MFSCIGVRCPGQPSPPPAHHCQRISKPPPPKTTPPSRHKPTPRASKHLLLHQHQPEAAGNTATEKPTKRKRERRTQNLTLTETEQSRRTPHQPSTADQRPRSRHTPPENPTRIGESTKCQQTAHAAKSSECSRNPISD